MRANQSGADAPDATKAGARWRAEDEHGESSYVSLEPSAGDLDAQLLPEAPGERAPVARHGPEAARQSRCALAQAGDDDEKLHGGASDDYEEEEEEEEDVTLFLSIPCATDDESHYITTHEILLAELSDNECDCGSSAAWDVEDVGATRARGARAERAAVSTLREDDPSDAARSSPSKRAGVGQIQLSITTTSRAINGPGRLLEEGNILYRATRSGDALRGAGKGKGEALRFAAAPQRVHFGPKLRDAIEHSSGTSSAVSEPDDADKEVRTLTAKTFRSLAHPCFDAANFGASSDSSASERGAGTNSWSALVDMNHGDKTTQSSTNTGSQGTIQAPGKRVCAHSNAGARNPPSPSTVELMGTVSAGQSGVVTLTETLNFRCNVKSGRSEGEKGTTRAHSAPGSRPAEDASKKAIFASSLIKNVISKKMQFEQERKMERGEISEQRQAASPCDARTVRRQSSRVSESSSDCTLTNAEDSGDAAGAETQSEAAADAPTRTLPRSHNSAFRRWGDEEADFPKDPKRDPSPRRGGKLTKMSHLFVPSIQLLPSEREAGQQPRDPSVCDDAEAARRRSDGADSRKAIKSRSPEIKINLRSVRNNHAEPAAASNLQASGVARDHVSRSQGDLRRQTLTAALKGESADKVPHFTVRDIRDNKAKLQTPIHQVRDVRKLVKSSYHFVSLDNDGRLPEAKRQPANKPPDSASPIVIKCQSVNTNSGGKQAESRVGEGEGEAKADRVAPKRRDRTPEPDRRSEPRTASGTALEKLQAAVRTMEQLYVFEKNEWKRKTDAPQLQGGRVLPMVASQERGASGDPGAGAAASPRVEDAHLKGGRTQAPVSTPVSTAGSKEALSLSSGAQAHSGAKSSAPKSAKPPKPSAREAARTRGSETPAQEPDEDYLAIPVKSQDQRVSVLAAAAQSPPRAQEDLRPASEGSGVVVEARPPAAAAAVYHGSPQSQPQLVCFSPAITPTPALERKLLLDPTTGGCYLVDSPVQTPTRRLFDPETGQYVDVAVPPPPTTPVPLSVSPLALGPGAYGHAYVIYPGFLPTPSVISAQTLDAPFYIATGKCAQPPPGAQQPATPNVALQPIISISSQQGPRIIAPPSFDGTTMSFVVEHR